MRKRSFWLGLLILVFVTSAGAAPAMLGRPAALDERATRLATINGQVLGLAKGWYARIETSKGTILARLHPDQAPQSVAYFTALAEGRLAWLDPSSGELIKNHFYDGVEIHKITAGRQFEAGEPVTESHVPPEFWIPPSEANQRVNFSQPFKLGMTRSALNRVSGVVFFVTASSMPFLNGRHPCFGTVIHGREAVLGITDSRAYSNGRPIKPQVIYSVRIFAAGSPDPLPEPKVFSPKASSFEMRKN